MSLPHSWNECRCIHCGISLKEYESHTFDERSFCPGRKRNVSGGDGAPSFTRQDLVELHTQLCERGRELLKKKNQDYAGATQTNCFGNLQDSTIFSVQPEIGVLILCNDKFKRIASLIETGALQVSDESAQDSIIDVINYMVLLAGLLKQRAARREPKDIKAKISTDNRQPTTNPCDKFPIIKFDE